MTTLEFFAVGEPKGQPRARACIRGKHAGVYDPGTADGWKMIVRHAARDAWDGATFTSPVSVSIRFCFPRPKSHFDRHGKLREGTPCWKVSKPDCDNLAKAVMDALTSMQLWWDDAQVVKLSVTKQYVTEFAGAEIIVDTLIP